jgi:hypothetical protein
MSPHFPISSVCVTERDTHRIATCVRRVRRVRELDHTLHVSPHGAADHL